MALRRRIRGGVAAARILPVAGTAAGPLGSGGRSVSQSPADLVILAEAPPLAGMLAELGRVFPARETAREASGVAQHAVCGDAGGPHRSSESRPGLPADLF